MSMSTMGENGEVHIPAGWAGQIDSVPDLDSDRPLANSAITAALQAIDHDIEQLLALRASLNGTAGLVALTDATDVTDSTGLALPASEKNALIDGTLANQISDSAKKNKDNSFAGFNRFHNNRNNMTILVQSDSDNARPGIGFNLNNKMDAYLTINELGQLIYVVHGSDHILAP